MGLRVGDGSDGPVVENVWGCLAADVEQLQNMGWLGCSGTDRSFFSLLLFYRYGLGYGMMQDLHLLDYGCRTLRDTR